MPFPYKTVLITGATSGIGLALAERMISNGIFVIAVGRRRERLEALVAKHGGDKVAAEQADVADLGSIPEWTKHITSTYPTLDCIVLNAGEQNGTSLAAAAADPSTASKLAATVTAETTINYLSPVHTVAHLLPHLASKTSSAIVLVSSGLALIPIARCANYCATKSALHSFAWTLRSQLRSPDSPGTHGVRVVEVIPPAVQTELHSRQPDLAAAGLAHFGMPLGDFTDETWAALTSEVVQDEILVGSNRERWSTLEDEKRKGFKMFEKMMRSAGKV